jgi:hypothetical protein
MNLIITTNKIVTKTLINKNKFVEYYSDANYEEYISNKLVNMKIIIIKNEDDFYDNVAYFIDKYNPTKIFLAGFCTATNNFYKNGDIIIPSELCVLMGSPTTWDSKKKLPSIKANKSIISKLKIFAEIASLDLYINKNITIKNQINAKAYKRWIHKNYLASSIDTNIYTVAEMLQKVNIPIVTILSVNKTYNNNKQSSKFGLFKLLSKDLGPSETISKFLETYSLSEKND